MTMRNFSRCGYIVASVLAIAATAAQTLGAQGTRRGVGGVAAAARVQPAASGVSPARSLLHSLVGTWRFEIWFAGNLDGAPDASGTRVVRALFDDLRVEWTEQLDHTAVQGQGMIGFDERSGRFYSTSLSNAGSGAEFMTGVPDPNEPRITFSPMSLLLDAGGGQQSAALSMLDQNHFTWAPEDHAWRAVFTRQAAQSAQEVRPAPDATPAQDAKPAQEAAPAQDAKPGQGAKATQ